jgi:hypothetical protein
VILGVTGNPLAGTLKAVTGVTRAMTRAVGAATLDVSSGVARAGEAAHAAVTGQRVGPATLRVRVVILSDEQGRPLTTEDRLTSSMNRADEVLTAGAGIRVRLTDVRVEPEPAPPQALAPHANRRLLLDDVLGHTEFYRRVSATAPLPGVTIGVPITVIVVKDIAGRVTGCSLGISADWVVVQASLFDRAQPHTYDDTVLVHELGHALNLPHHPNRDNVMFPASSPPTDVRGTGLRGWQAAVLHANRHVIPGVPD